MIKLNTWDSDITAQHDMKCKNNICECLESSGQHTIQLTKDMTQSSSKNI